MARLSVTDVYRTAPRRSHERWRVLEEELVIPILAIGVGALLLVIAVWSAADGVPHVTEGGFGTIFLLFGAYAFVEAIRSMPRVRTTTDAGGARRARKRG